MNHAVVGLGFGDEGKGLVTSYLCSKYEDSIVIRYSGGHQAGHTVVYKDKRHVFSSFGSGTLQEKPTYWSKWCTFCPVSFVNEYDILKVKVDNIVFKADPLCPVTTPFDVYANILAEVKNGHGSVGVGFGATWQRHENYYKLHLIDLFNEKIFNEKMKAISNYYDITPEKLETYSPGAYNNFKNAVYKLRDLSIVELESFYNIETDYSNLIFEGSQGILLDQDLGFFPNVTRCNIGARFIESRFSIGLDHVNYVTRTYLTRHGNGYFPDESDLNLRFNENETNIYNHHQGKLRIAPMDVDLLNYSLTVDSPYYISKSLFITCCDQYHISQELEDWGENFGNMYYSFGPSYKNIKKIT